MFNNNCWYRCQNKNASEYFKDKFVFYSPKITYGIDSNISNAQNVFIYVKGRTLTPYGTLQQCTRTRNIESIYFYCECYDKEEQYHNIEVLQDSLKESLNHYKMSAWPWTTRMKFNLWKATYLKGYIGGAPDIQIVSPHKNIQWSLYRIKDPIGQWQIIWETTSLSIQSKNTKS